LSVFGFSWLNQLDWVNNAVIGTRAGHPFMAHCLTSLRNTYAQYQHIPRGPELLTAVLRRAGLVGYGRQDVRGVTLLPRECFYPYAWMHPPYAKTIEGMVRAKAVLSAHPE
jgi:hypothetical protein